MIPTLVGPAGTILYNVATGGTVTDIAIDGLNYRLHTFTANDTFTIQAAVKTFDLLLVGGGSNGATAGGGGGAVNSFSKQTMAVQAYTVTVGGVNGGSYLVGPPVLSIIYYLTNGLNSFCRLIWALIIHNKPPSRAVAMAIKGRKSVGLMVTIR